MNYDKFIERIFTIGDTADFNNLALELFRLQSVENLVYKSYLDLLGVDTQEVKDVEDIPFLPIEFFKSQSVITGNWNPEKIFSSSGTSGPGLSKHHIKELSLYKRSFIKGFESVYGAPQGCIFICLLPNYQENKSSSLIFMIDELIRLSNNELSGYYLDQENDLVTALDTAVKTDKQVVLFGVSYALIDLAQKSELPNMEGVIVMETGGMKGNRKEMVKEELHRVLENGFGIEGIHSEYGMTELLSQAYAKSKGVFGGPPWMRVAVRDVNDPLNNLPIGRSGGLNIIDLANVYSCAFIATQDLGKVHEDGTFELLGRFDHSDIRGCNLLVADG